jgi:5'-3' exonuclease
MAIIDGDVLCYLSFEPRWEYSVDAQGQKIMVYDEERQKFVPKMREYTKDEDALYLRQTWDRFKRKLTELVEKLYCDDYLMAVQGDYNFRSEVYDLYKNNRSSKSKPSEMSRFIPTLRKLVVHEDLGIASHGCEADDYIRIWARQCEENGKDFVIASIDKDLKCIPGKHYNIKSETIEEISHEQALRLYHEQLLSGDQIDCIPGIPGIGPIKATRALQDCKTLDEFQCRVVEVYIDSFGENWKQHLLANGKLIHIMRHETDWFNLQDWPVIQSLENAK